MTTLQEKRHRETINSIARVTAQRDACLDRIVRLEVKLRDLRRQEARQAKALARPKPVPAPTPPPAPEMQPVATPEAGPADADAIPAFLDRRSAGQKADDEARARIEAANAATKKAKAAVRIEKLKVAQEVKQAKLTGQTKRMPLTGRAALDHIRNG